MAGDAEVLDVVVVGAGISGISAGHHLQALCPDRSFVILEARDRPGGTWDVFRYPGARSDSDMHTLGFAFRPWTGARAIVDAPTILGYLDDTVRESGLERRIRCGRRVERADWSSADALWTLALRHADGGASTLRCRFLFLCAGYYDEVGHRPDFPGSERFRGRIVHPQHWPADLDCAGRSVVVVGSGATAVTLVPALARTAAHVTMLQRSPTWIAALPSVDPIGRRLQALLPRRAAAWLTRWKNILASIAVFELCRRRPQRMRAVLLAGVRRALGGSADVAPHFVPRYDPWRQRLCVVPDGDLFEAVRTGRVAVVTDEIATFTETGIALRSGAVLDADVVVSATGLVLATAKVPLHVDDRPVVPAQTVSYKGVMFSGVPNCASTFGYTNASWTLKADLTSRYVCRLLNHMRRSGARVCMPPAEGPAGPRRPWIDFTSGYFERAAAALPRQGSAPPWRLNQNYLRDLVALRWRRVDDGVLEFSPHRA